MSAVSKHIKKQRLTQGLTQEALAERLFVTRQTISNWETGKSQPDVDTLLRIAEALQTDAGALIYGPPAKPNQKKEVRKLTIAAGLLLLLGGLAWYLAPIFHRWAGTLYIMEPNMLLHTLLLPLVFLLAGWTVMQSLGVMGVAKPLEQGHARSVCLVLLGLLALYALPTLLFSAETVYCLLQSLHYQNNPALSPDGFCYTYFTPVALVPFCWHSASISFLFLLPGALLWLTKPRKWQKKKTGADVATPAPTEP